MAPSTPKIIGGPKNFWLWSKKGGFDLTHPINPEAPPVSPRITVETTKEPATIDPNKTALVVIDFQNYFLSPLLGRPSPSAGLNAVDKLLEIAIPACRQAKIPVVWLGWGLDDKDLEDTPPTIFRGFGLDTNFDTTRNFGGPGDDIGELVLEDGTSIQAGRALMRDQWNTELYPSLVKASRPGDIWVYKNRLSGFWGGTGIEDILDSRGVRTLLFAGGNLDQCVSSTMQDAYQKGWDVLLLSDGSATNSPKFATQMVHFNCENGWGFVLTCKQLAAGVDGMGTGHGSTYSSVLASWFNAKLALR